MAKPGRSLSRWPLPGLGSFLSARVGRRLHYRDITPTRALIGRAQPQVCAIGLHCNKARPALPQRLTSRLRRGALSGPGGRSEFLAELASGLLLFTATPPARGRAHTHAHSVSGLGAVSPESDLGCSPAHLASGLSLPAVSGRVPRPAPGPPWGVSLWRTPSLCHLRPGSPVRHSPDTARRSGLERAAHSDTKSAFVTPSVPPPLPERAHVDAPHRVSASCVLGSSPTPGPPSVRGNTPVRAPNAGELRTTRTVSKLCPKPQLTRAWVSRDRPRLGPALSARSSPRVPVPCADLS